MPQLPIIWLLLAMTTHLDYCAVSSLKLGWNNFREVIRKTKKSFEKQEKSAQRKTGKNRTNHKHDDVQAAFDVDTKSERWCTSSQISTSLWGRDLNH